MKYTLKDTFIATSIILMPGLLFIYEFIPKVQSLKILHFTLKSGEYMNMNVLIWILSFKLFTILILTLWYVSCKHWWKHAILVPLIIELIKFFGVFYSKHDFIDEIDFLYSLPFTIPIIYVIIIISKRLNYYSITHDFKDEIDEEINSIFSELASEGNKKINSVIADFKLAKLNKNNLGKEEYIDKLKSFKNRLKNF